MSGEGGRRRRGGQGSAGDFARGLLGRIDRRGGMARAKAVSAWAEVAGAEVAEHACGFAMREGELVVFVDSPVWASELSALSEHYRRAVNEHLGEELVSAIRFNVSKTVEERRSDAGRQAEVQASYDADRVATRPADETERAQIEQMASVIPKESVRRAVSGAALADLEWKKGLKARRPKRGSKEPPEGPENAPKTP